MKEYIEREAAVSMAHGYCHTTDGRCCGPDDVVELYEELKAIPAADVVDVDSVIPFVRVCDRKELIKNSEKLINEYIAELLERFGIRCWAQIDNINGTVKFWAEKIDGGVNDAAD